MSARVVLAVAVEGGDPGSAGRTHSARDRGALTRPLPLPDHFDPRLLSRQPRQTFGAAVVAPVVDVDDLVVHPALERAADLAGEPAQVVGLVVDGNYDGQLGGHSAEFRV